MSRLEQTLAWLVDRWQSLPSLHAFWNRGLPPAVRITPKVIWPLLMVPVALFNQIFAPHPVWIVLLITLLGIYGIGLYWVRAQALTVTLVRKRIGTILVAGDVLREEFTLHNQSHLPVLWAEFTDHANLPGYNSGRVVGCGANTTYRWHTNLACRQRGVYRLGPHELSLGDPFGLFALELDFDHQDVLLIYPRVAQLPTLALPHGQASGTARRRRPLWGALPSASVREYRPTDSLRYIHWPLTAHRGAMMVKELEIEPSGAVWIVLDLNAAAHSGVDESSTLEFSVILAASLAAELLTNSDRRAVGLLTVSNTLEPLAVNPDLASGLPLRPPPSALHIPHSTIAVPPQPGQAQMWRILAALAPVQATALNLADLLRTHRTILGVRSTVFIITPQLGNWAEQGDWTAELLHQQAQGVVSSLMLVTPAGVEDAAAAVQNLLARHEIPAQTWAVGTHLPAALTFRRTRTIVRSTPTGGVATYEVEEEVG